MDLLVYIAQFWMWQGFIPTPSRWGSKPRVCGTVVASTSAVLQSCSGTCRLLQLLPRLVAAEGGLDCGGGLVLLVCTAVQRLGDLDRGMSGDWVG